MARTYTRDDVQTHSDGFRPSRPAVNVKVYTTIRNAYAQFQKDEQPDPRFTLEWIEDTFTDEYLDGLFWHVAAHELEYLTAYATEDEDAIFPAKVYGTVTIEQEGRSGGWLAVDGLPDLEEWDAILLARWRKFERVARDISQNVPYQMLGSLYENEWETAEAERAETAGVEADVAIALAQTR